MMALTALFKALFAVGVAHRLALAAKDSDYYPPGVFNPNINQKMYWKDAVNVLQDLDQFESLHIMYHGCVWSKYGARYGSGEYYDYNDQENDGTQGINVNNGCGGDGGEYYWYMGRTQCFRANVAYSLYGVLKGTFHSGNACGKSTFINSFFTNYGIESFSGPLGLDVDAANSYCTSQEPENGQNNYYDGVDIDDDYLSSDVQFVNYEAYTSYGTGCSAGKFVTDKYSGAFCHGDLYQETLDTLDSFNSAIESLGCTQIYSSSDSGGRRLENEEFDFTEMSTVNILSFSTACDSRQYPQECPDPFGKKGLYDSNLERFLSGMPLTSQRYIQRVSNVLSVCFILFGGLLMALAYRVHRKNIRRKEDEVIQRQLRRMKKIPGNPQEPPRSPPSSPPPSPPREKAAPSQASDNQEFWRGSTKVSKTAARLKEKFRMFMDPKKASPIFLETTPSQEEIKQNQWSVAWTKQ